MGQGAGARVVALVIGDKDAALDGVHQLAGLQTEAADVAERANLAPFVGRAMRMRAVFNDRQIMLFRDL
jgi:hypothetical protein